MELGVTALRHKFAYETSALGLTRYHSITTEGIAIDMQLLWLSIGVSILSIDHSCEDVLDISFAIVVEVSRGSI